MFNRSRAFLGAALAMAIGAAGMPALQSLVHPQVVVSSKRKRGLFNGMVLPSSGALVGSRASRNTVAQAKRAQVKRANQQRHKRASQRRGARR